MKTPASSWFHCRAAAVISALSLGLAAVHPTRATAANDNTPPSVPTGLTATTLSCGEVSLTWDASTDQGGSAVRGYRIFRSGNYVTEVAASSTTYVDSGLSPSATYSYTVSATDTAGNESLPSAAVQATTQACGDTTPPGSPTGLTATPLDCTSVSLSWNASLDIGGAGIRGYRILRNGVFVTEVAAPATTFVDGGLSEGHTYGYRVSAKDRANNESAQSGEAVAALVPCNDTAAPSAPTELKALAVNCGQARLSWNPSTDVGGSGIRSYRILRNGTLVTEVSAGTTTFLDQGLSPSRPYSYVVTAKDRSNNESGNSNPGDITTPPCDVTTPPSVPTAIVATPGACGQIDLSWGASTAFSGSELRGYRIFRNGVYVTEVGAAGTAFSDTAISPLRNYDYTVSAVDKAGNESAQSEPGTVMSPSCGVLFKGDFNQDRHTDVVLQHTDGSVAFWTMNGTTIVGGVTPYTIPAGWQIVGAGDFNRDDNSDLVLEHTDRSVAFWLMKGTTILEGIVPLQLPEGWHIAATGDFNQDTTVDLVLQSVGGATAFWFMNGTSAIGTQVSYQLPEGWRIAGTGRFNNDNHPDIVLQRNDGSVAFWLMEGTTILSGIVAYQIPAGWQIVATGNYTPDNDTDIVLQHSDGSVAFWKMAGTTITEGVVPYVIPAGWQIAGPR